MVFNASLIFYSFGSADVYRKEFPNLSDGAYTVDR